MSSFKIQTALCEREDENDNDVIKPDDELPTQEQSQPALADSLGIEDELFQEDDTAKLLPTLDYYQAVSYSAPCNPIDGQVLADLIKSQSHPVIIIDCRFDYEFAHGHIKGAINIDNSQLFIDTFFRDANKIREIMSTQSIMVFHCEFSQKRAPNMFREVRDYDRQRNLPKYPKLFFPEMYVLEKGFSGFYERFPDLCQGGYKRQAGDKLEKSRVRSLQRNRELYKCQLQQEVPLKKSASTGYQDSHLFGSNARISNLSVNEEGQR